MERKLASIRKVSNLLPIPGANFIECAVIDGWEVVTKKGEFQVNDLCVYFEIDSFLPEDPRYAFLKDLKTHQDRKGYRLKTIRLRKQISQGLALPLSHFPELVNSQEGDDATNQLNVIKYDVSISSTEKKPGLRTGSTAGKFPSFIPKTDQERIQNLPTWFTRYTDVVWEETLKLDGSSCTMYKVERDLTWFEKIKSFLGFKVNPVHFGVCSRNLEIKRNDSYEKTFDNDGKQNIHKQSDFWTIAKKYNIEQKLPVGFALQGELIGPRIQSNHEKVEDLMYFVFDVWDIKEQRYLTPYERNDFVKTLGILHVPVLGYVNIFNICKDVHELLERVKGESMNPNTISEGRVYKSLDSTKSFKCINNDYLLKCEQ